MARKEKTVIVPMEGRDKGKHFKIVEMPASQAEKWAARAFLALAHAGIEVPQEFQGAGMAAIAVIGLQALGKVAWNEAEPLLDEMMKCVQYQPDPSRPLIVRPVMDDDIEEVMTRFWLRGEIFELHVGFSIAGAISTSEPAPEAEEKTSQSISTFRKRLQR